MRFSIWMLLSLWMAQSFAVDSVISMSPNTDQVRHIGGGDVTTDAITITNNFPDGLNLSLANSLPEWLVQNTSAGYCSQFPFTLGPKESCQLSFTITHTPSQYEPYTLQLNFTGAVTGSSESISIQADHSFNFGGMLSSDPSGKAWDVTIQDKKSNSIINNPSFGQQYKIPLTFNSEYEISVTSKNTGVVCSFVDNGSDTKTGTVQGYISGQDILCQQPEHKIKVDVSGLLQNEKDNDSAKIILTSTLTDPSNDSDSNIQTETLNIYIPADSPDTHKEFSFTNTATKNMRYNISIDTKNLTGGQTCNISNNQSGTVNDNDVTVAINCTTPVKPALDLNLAVSVDGLGAEKLNLIDLVSGNKYLIDGSKGSSFNFDKAVKVGGSYYLQIAPPQPFAVTCGLVCQDSSPCKSDSSKQCSPGCKDNNVSSIPLIKIKCDKATITPVVAINGVWKDMGCPPIIVTNQYGGDFVTFDKSDESLQRTFKNPLAYGAAYKMELGENPSGLKCILDPDTASGNAGSSTALINISCTATPILTASPSSLNLSVKGHEEYGIPSANTTSNLQSGKTRTFTLKNDSLTSTGVVTINNIVTANLPSGTTVAGTCKNNLQLPQKGSCTIEVTPGTAPSCGSGKSIDPTTSPTITVSFQEIDPLKLTYNILDYGCIYQDGVIFAFDDSPEAGYSVAGKIVAKTEYQSQGWHPEENAVCGISSGSKTDLPLPYNTQQPCKPEISSGCDADTDGACNTNVIFLSEDARTVQNCRTSRDDTSGWYVPAQCEMAGCCKTVDCADIASSPNHRQNIFDSISTLSANGVSEFKGQYWSSTQQSPPKHEQFAWAIDTELTDSRRASKNKDNALKVRCVRRFQ